MKKLLALLTSCLFILIVTTSLSNAQVSLPSVFSDNMVLQQQTDAAFWGKTDPGSKVSVRTSWNGKSYSAKADKDGKWKTTVSTPAAGGPYTVTISEEDQLPLRMY